MLKDLTEMIANFVASRQYKSFYVASQKPLPLAARGKGGQGCVKVWPHTARYL
jgi:hypothetical protein